MGVVCAHLENEEMNGSGILHTLSHLILTVISEMRTYPHFTYLEA